MSSSPRKPRAAAELARARQPRPPRPRPSAGGEGVRLQKVLAAAGVASRRAAEDLIDQGRVAVNGSVVTVQGMRVDPARDRIEVDGERIATDERFDYVIVNKPRGVVTTAKDPQGRQTIMDLVESEQRVYPVGRLDIDTTGLVLLTNHGELAHRLAHPRYAIERVYVARVKGTPDREAMGQLRDGVMLEDGVARAARVKKGGAAGGITQLEIVMTEGRKREVRRMLEAVGHPVESLARIAFGPLRLGRLKVGGMRRLRSDEVGQLLKLAGL